MIKEVDHVGDKMIKRSDQFKIEWFIDNSRLSNYYYTNWNLLDLKTRIESTIIRFDLNSNNLHTSNIYYVDVSYACHV